MSTTTIQHVPVRASRSFPDRALGGKPVAVIDASTGLIGGVWAQAETRDVLAYPSWRQGFAGA
jgi:NAD(P)H-dependent FMN reductase